MKIKFDAWIIVNDVNGPYVDYRFTKKEMIRHHLETMGHNSWKDAKSFGDRAVKVKISYKTEVSQITHVL